MELELREVDDAVCQSLVHGFDAGKDGAAPEFALRVDDIEVCCGSGIDDDGTAFDVVFCPECVDDAILSDGFWVIVVDFDGC